MAAYIPDRCIAVNTAIKYAVFAAISTAINLLGQYIGFLIYDGLFSLYFAMLLGTLAGLVSKYILDKKYIFYHQPKSRADDGKKFILYAVTGIFTTIIFWGTEITFDMLFSSHAAKYIGAVIGLSIGYVCKYFLDSHFIFRTNP